MEDNLIIVEEIMLQFEYFIKQSSKNLGITKEKMLTILNPFFSQIDSNTKIGRQKRKEIIDLVKFIVVSENEIEILKMLEEPDFLVSWNGCHLGLEHTQVVNEVEKRKFQKNEWFIKQTYKKFIEKYGDIKHHINISLNQDISEISAKEKGELLSRLSNSYSDYKHKLDYLFLLAHPGKLTRTEMDKYADEMSSLIYNSFYNKTKIIENRLIRSCSFMQSSKTSFHLSMGYSVGSMSDLILSTIKKKEQKILTYTDNTNTKQCLFLVIDGSVGYSDYAQFDSEILKNKKTKFEKVIVLNFFKEEIYILK